MNKYVIFWLSQAVSQLGSSLTSYALILWIYEQAHRAMDVSMMSFCLYLPYILVGLFSGGFIDTHSKKKTMLVCDSIAAVCSLFIVLLVISGKLTRGHIFLVNAVIGVMNSLQNPCTRIVTRLLVPPEKMEKAYGLTSLSDNFITILSPILSAALYGIGGLGIVLAVDLCTFIFAFTVLFFFVHPAEEKVTVTDRISPFEGIRDGFSFLLQHRGLLAMMLNMALINFLTKITYENIVSPLVLARTGDDYMVLSAVNAAMGIAGIVGGVWVSMKKPSSDYVRQVFVNCALSFLLGDILIGLGRGPALWILGGIGANFFYPVIISAQEVIQSRIIPGGMQGRVYAVRNAIQFGTMPWGLLLGGYLADHVFEPLMASGSSLAIFLSTLTGSGAGSGMSVMFLCTGALGTLSSLWACFSPAVRQLKKEI